MRVLLYSAVLYLFGVAVVLYLRPTLMFKNNGQWKEFGVQGVDTTYFPFWLFCIVWAVVAYGSVSLFSSDKTVLKEAAAASLTAQMLNTPINQMTNVGASAPSGAEESEATEEAAPGYYKLDKGLMKRKGVPRYIYVGEEKPSDLEDV